MTLLALFLVGCFFAGGTHRLRFVRERRMVFLATATLVAAAFYQLRVIM